MTNKKTTRRALFMSIISLLLCCSMLVGTTFAWFTDSVTSGQNIIAAGNLDVELYYKNDTVSNWTPVTAESNVFKTNTLWEPGHTEVVKLKVVNAGSLALKYQLGVNVASETGSVNMAGAEFKLSDYIKFGIIEGDTNYNREEAVAEAEKSATNLSVAYTTDEYLEPATENKESADIVTMVVYMPTSVDNAANHKFGAPQPVINLGINLMATQKTYERDSFDDQYDKDAWHPDFTVSSTEELATALANGGKIQVNGTLNAGATQDVPNWTNAPAEFIFDATTLDALKGGNYVLEQGSRYGVVALISAGESLALSDMKITANSQWPVYLSNYGGTLTLEDIDVTATQGAGIYPYGTNGTTTIKSATVNQKALSDEFASSTPWAGTAIATSNGHNLIIEDGTYVGSTWGVYVYNSGANVTINGGTFKAPKVIQADGVWSTGGNKSVVTVNDGNFDGALYLDWGTTPPEIYINGGNFTNFSATVNGTAKLVIKGGTFDADPSAYVASGYKAVQNSDGTWSVRLTQESFDSLIGNAQPGDTVSVPAGNFTLSGNNNIVINGSGEDTVITVDGALKNANISNATIAGNTQIAVSAGQTLELTNVVFEGEAANFGNVHGTAVFTGCTFNGLLHFDSSAETATVKFVDCTFSDTCVIKLGGSADYVMEDCVVETLDPNASGPWGKEWLIHYSDLTMTDCTIGRVIRAGAKVNINLNNCVDAEGAAVTQAIVHTYNDPYVWIDGVAQVRTTEGLQAAFDSAAEGTTIQLAPSVAYGAVELRPAASNGTTMVCTSCNYTTTDAKEFKAHLDDGKWHTTPDYTTNFKNVTIIGAEGATVAGFTATSGHAYGDVYDYVRDKDYDAGSAYYNTFYISNLTFKNVNFTGKLDINTSDADTKYDGVTFVGCTFTTGGTASTNGSAIRYYNESNNGNVKNITVKNCTFTNCYQGIYVAHVNGITVTDSSFDTTGHNAIGIQNHSGAVDLKNVVITGNTFNNIGDRVIRFNEIGADSNITIQNNTATNSGDEDGQVMKATSIASGVTTSISGNNWGTGVIANDELKDN